MNSPQSRVFVEGLKASLLLLLPAAILLAAAYAIGLQLPEEHTAVASGVVQAPPERVWELLQDFSQQVNWRKGPLILVRGPKREIEDQSCWMEGWLLARVTLCQVDAQPPTRRLVHTVPSATGLKLPFDATWTFELAPAGNATAVTITEESAIDSPMERFIGRFLLRQNTGVRQYLYDLQGEALHHP